MYMCISQIFSYNVSIIINYYLTNSSTLQYAVPSSDSILFYRGHKLSVTSLCVSPNDRHVYTGSKDCCIIKCKEYSWTPLLQSNMDTSGTNISVLISGVNLYYKAQFGSFVSVYITGVSSIQGVLNRVVSLYTKIVVSYTWKECFSYGLKHSFQEIF